MPPKKRAAECAPTAPQKTGRGLRPYPRPGFSWISLLNSDATSRQWADPKHEAQEKEPEESERDHDLLH